MRNNEQLADIEARASAWARVHAEIAYNYSSRSSWYHKAMTGGAITRDEYDLAQDALGDLFYYTGD